MSTTYDDVRDWGMDTNKSTTKVVPLNINSPRPPHLKEALDMIDKDKSGYIDAEELSLLLKLQGINASKKDVKNIIKMYHSSSSIGDELSFEEFCILL